MTPEEEGELVGTGGFRVAGARALEVLRSTQLKDGFWRPLLWLRVAAALEAAQVKVALRRSGLSISFDGRPLPKTLVTDPLSLFEGAPSPPEARWLAYALVHSALPEVTVTLASGRGPGRCARRFEHHGQGTSLPPPSGAGTEVSIDWPDVPPDGPGPWSWFSPNEGGADPRLAAADSVPFELKTPAGTVLPWEKRKDHEAAFLRDGARRIRVSLGGGGRLTLHTMGVRVWGAALDDLALPLAVDVDDPGLTLDASLSSVVEDKAFHHCVASGRDAAVKHGHARLERHAESMRLCADLLVARPGLRLAWKAALADPERVDRRLPWIAWALGALQGRRLPSGDALRVTRTARFAAFLRQAATEKLRGRAFDARLPLGLALWETPLLLSATGRPLSLWELDPDGTPCSVWDKNVPAPAGLGAKMVWGLSGADREFAYSFPRRRARMG